MEIGSVTEAQSGGTARLKSNSFQRRQQLGRNIMRMFIVAAVGSVALVTAPVAGASTSQSSNGKRAVEQQTTTLKIAQNQDTKQRGQDYNKQDTTKRKSWGGG
jgi:hypothetical protein